MTHRSRCEAEVRVKSSVQYQQRHVLSYADYGDKTGYPILVQHGLIATITDAYLFQRLLDNGARLICIARPGYGDSSPYHMRTIAEWAAIVAVLVEELRIPQFDVLGISSGAPYSYALGYHMPAQVRNLFIFSGTPALYDDQILAAWPYPTNKEATLAELQTVAYELFFAHLSSAERTQPAMQDSLRNACFGIAQDLKLRSADWGFTLAQVNAQVYMRHSKVDTAVPFVTAAMTASLLPHCQLETRENDVHFSDALLDNFIQTVMVSHYA